MNFASLMSAQIAKSKKTPTPAASESKYLKRSELEDAREKAYREEQAAIEATRKAKAEKKRKLEEEEEEIKQQREMKRLKLAEESKRRQAEEDEKIERERRRRLGLPDVPKRKESELDGSTGSSPLPDDMEDIPDEELIIKLREIEEPIRIFGETHQQRLIRYRKLTKHPEAHTKPSKYAGPIPTSLEPVPEIDMKVTAKIPPASDKVGRLFLSRQLASWFTLVLREWAIALASRPDEVKNTFAGRAAENSMTQALDHLKPMFRKLEKVPDAPAELPDDLLIPIAEIVLAAQERRYVDANDGYLQLSIGKAAWPIGVTMVGIHERSAREKLHESDKGKAHIMADEVTRKILQSIKRCLSFAQTRWPPEDLGQLMG